MARTVKQIKRDIAEWASKLDHRSAHLKHYKKHGAVHHEDEIKRYSRLVREAKSALSVLKKELREEQQQKSEIWTPKIVGWGQTGISPNNVFGPLGPETKVTTHYAASPRARNLAEGIKLTKQFDSYHRSKGWGGVSYHYLIPDTGELILGRSTSHKGAHALNTNSNNIGINFFCTTGHQPTKAQAKTFLWLLANAHTDKLPSRHRTDRDLRKADIRGHNQWPGQSTSCPGNFTPANLRRIAS